jgi:hypothetical protein
MTPATGGNVPYRNAAVSALFGGGTPAAKFNPAIRGRWTGRLVSRVPLGPRCRKSGSVLGWRAPDHRLTRVGLGPRGSGPLLEAVGRQPPASSLASKPSSGRSRVLIRPRAERQLDSRSPSSSTARHSQNCRPAIITTR